MSSTGSDEISLSCTGLRISNRFIPPGYRPRTSDSVPNQSNPKPNSPLKRRRSVSSMKGLMPLTLSPSSLSSQGSYRTGEEDIDHKVDGYFPEILAQDLETQMSVFAARRMTAGTPTPSLTFDEKMRARFLSGNNNKVTPPSSYHTALERVQSLGAIKERSSMVSFLDQREAKSEDVGSDEINSLTDTDSSADNMPPSFRFRKQSVATAATSLASASWRPSPKHTPPPPEECFQYSWINNDSEAEAEGEENGQLQDDDDSLFGVIPLSPRPPTPPESDLEHTSLVPNFGATDLPHISKSIAHGKSHSVSGALPFGSLRKGPPIKTTASPWNGYASVTTENRDERLPREPISSSVKDRPRLLLQVPPYQYRRSRSLQQRKHSGYPLKLDIKPQYPLAEPSPISDDFTNLDDDDDVDDGLPPLPLEPPPLLRHESVYIRPTPPPSPLPTVQAWLNGSVQPYGPVCQNDELAKVVPLPPDVIENLRISIACFPETMLLSSSLTIETIRTYSKKVRNPNMDFLRHDTPEAMDSASRKSLWRKVVPYRRTAQASDQRRGPSRRSAEDMAETSNSMSSQPYQPWLPLKNVFGCCSDYICDAIYAHIVAYNYISTLVASLPPPPKAGRVRGDNDRQKDDIPKKAASLLGLGSAPDQSLVGVSRFAKKFNTPFGNLVKEEMITKQTESSAGQNNAIRGIQAGLLKSICRLGATAKLMSESGSAEERMVETDGEDMDMLFIRSLCEIVKMAEESG